MTARVLLDRLQRQGVRFCVTGDRVQWRAPAGTMTDAILARLRDDKVEVITILSDAEADAVEERAAIIHEAHTRTLADDGTPLAEPIFGLTWAEAEALASERGGHVWPLPPSGPSGGT